MTRHPTDAWTAQQLRQATPWGDRPRYLLRDNDCTYGTQFARVAATSRIEVLRTPVHAPRANAICERFLGSGRRECLDHLMILHKRQVRRVLHEDVTSVSGERPHHGIGQAIPNGDEMQEALRPGRGTVVSLPVLGGLHHAYRLVA